MSIPGSVRTLWLVSLLAIASAALIASTQQPVARYAALAVDLTASGGQAATPVTIVISRWATDAERDQLVSTLKERGPEAALTHLRDMSRAGSIGAPGSVGMEIRFARRVQAPDGGQRLVLVTERPLSFWERRDAGRSTEYPFTLIEIRLGPNGKGEGKVSLATKVMVDREANIVVLENYSDQPILLQEVTAL
jgi:hypothetical protein